MRYKIVTNWYSMIFYLYNIDVLFVETSNPRPHADMNVSVSSYMYIVISAYLRECKYTLYINIIYQWGLTIVSYPVASIVAMSLDHNLRVS